MFVYGFGVYTVFLEVECKSPTTIQSPFSHLIYSGGYPY